MNLVKKTLVVVLTSLLVVACSKPEDTKTVAEPTVTENTSKCGNEKCGDTSESKCGESSESKCGDSSESKCGEEKCGAEAEKAALEEAEKLAAEAKAAEEATKAEAERQAAEAAAQAEAEKKAAAEAAKAEAQRIAAEAAAKKKAAEKAAQAEAEKLAAETEANKKAAAEAAQAEAEKLATAKEAEMKAAEDAAKAEAERLAEEAAAKAEAEKKAAEAAAKAEAARLAAQAKPKQEEYKMNSSSGAKTPVGAERAGNAAGTIPAWTGGITQPPSSYKPGDHHQDPFAGDKVLFTIDSSNYKDYEDNLSVGQKAMFEKYPETYKMNVYQSRRSASFPQRIYDKTVENGKTGKLLDDGEGVSDVAEGFPFPNPQNAYELMWNHKLKYKGSGGVRYNNQVAPTATGQYTLVRLKEELLGKYYAEGNTIADIDNILLYFYQVVESPARLAGRILLVHETMNQKETPRQAWIYNPGQRRVRRAPNVAYDNPGTASDGLRTNDMTDMFNGAMDRFDWKVVGKKEMYIPYNSYKVHSGDLDYSEIVQPGHLNADLMRYELHRVYIVDATLKEGVRHINSRRTFYLDEDSYQIMLIDHYDRRGEIWRFSEAHCINYYDVPTFWSTVETHHDLRSGRYVAVGLDNKDPVNTFNSPLSESNYSPQALRSRGRR